jgi:hypothetical protein
VVDLVEHHEGVPGQAGQGARAAGHLLVGGHQAVDVRGQPAGGRRPGRVQVKVERLGGIGPLHLQVLGGRHHQQAPPGVLGQVLARRRQREGGLAGAGRRDRQEVLPRAGAERLECRLLPAAQLDRSGHEQPGTIAGRPG